MDCARRCGTSRRARSTRTCRRTTTRRAWYEYWPSSSSLPSHWPLSLHRPGPAQPSPVRAPSRLWPQLLWFHSRVQHCTMYSTLLYSYMWMRLRPQLHPTRPDTYDTTRATRTRHTSASMCCPSPLLLLPHVPPLSTLPSTTSSPVQSTHLTLGE